MSCPLAKQTNAIKQKVVKQVRPKYGKKNITKALAKAHIGTFFDLYKAENML